MDDNKHIFKTALTVVLVYIILEFFKLETFSFVLKLTLTPVITFFYFLNVKEKSIFFMLFLVFYALGDITQFIDFNRFSIVMYFICNLLYIIAYFLLLLEIFNYVSLKSIIKKLPLQVLVLLVLSSFITYKLVDIVQVAAVNDAGAFYVDTLETTYNIMLLLLLTFSLLYFLYRGNRKSFIMFGGSFFIVFSELILLGYYYLSTTFTANLISGIFYMLAFFCFYYQSTITKSTGNRGAELKSK